MFDVHVIPAEVSTFHRARVRSNFLVAAHENVKSTKTFELDVSSVSVLFSFGNAEETHGEQGIEEATTTNHASTDQITDGVAAQIGVRRCSFVLLVMRCL